MAERSDRAIIRLKINGREISAEKGMSILEVCRANEIFVPTLCYDERLEAIGGCRLCLVEIKGSLLLYDARRGRHGD